MSSGRASRSDLAEFIAATPISSSHEHTEFEAAYVADPPDVLTSLFDNYVLSDLVVAGARPEHVARLLDRRDPDIRSRFQSIASAWEASRHTGHGSVVTRIARHLYGIDEIGVDSLESAQSKLTNASRAGERLSILRGANLDHVQVDHMDRHVPVDAFGQDFFLYDINLCSFANGMPELENLLAETGVEVVSLSRLDEALAVVFERNADMAVAVKSQHAYHRTLRWEARSDGDAGAALEALRRHGRNTPHDMRLCLGDWCLSRIAGLAARHDLPVKLHTGYHTGYGTMTVDLIRSGHLCPLLQAYPRTRFVLMHIAYPYDNELIAVAKHFPNVSVDLCWAWTLNPRITSEFVRRMLHGVPVNKVFGFGGDSRLPAASAGYALQARDWLTRVLEAEMADGLLSEADAIAIAERYLMRNQYDHFNIDRKKERNRAATPETGRSLGRADGFVPSIAAYSDRLHALWR